MKHGIAILIRTIGLIGLVFWALFFVEGKPSLRAAEPIKIGAVLGVTGKGAFLGTPDKEAITVVTEQVNRQGGVLGRQIEVYFEDDQTNPTISTLAATKLIRDNKVCCVIGSSIVDAMRAVIPICEQEQVPNVGLAPITDFHKWTFIVPLTDDVLSQKMLDFTVNTLGARKIALLHDTDQYGMAGAKGVMENINKYAASIVIHEQFNATDTSMIPQLTKTKAAQPDAIILYTYATPAIVIAKNYYQLGMKTPVVAPHGVPDPHFIEQARNIIEGGRWVIYGDKDFFADLIPPDDPWRKHFDPLREALKEKYGRTEFPPVAGIGYDGMHILIEALKIAGTDDRAALRDALEKVRYQGMMGNYAYSPTNHTVSIGQTDIQPIIMKNGKLQPYFMKYKERPK